MKTPKEIFADHFELKNEIREYDSFDDIRYSSNRIKPNAEIMVSEIYELINKAQIEAYNEAIEDVKKEKYNCEIALLQLTNEDLDKLKK